MPANLRNLTPLPSAPAAPTGNATAYFAGAQTQSLPVFGSGNVRLPAAPTTTPAKQLAPEQARQILAEAGGDKNRARQIAAARGFTF
jgi:hypothetical protein